LVLRNEFEFNKNNTSADEIVNKLYDSSNINGKLIKAMVPSKLKRPAFHLLFLY